MTIYVKDAMTDSAVRKLAKLRGVSLTAAIHDAVEAQLEATKQNKQSLWDRTKDLRDIIASHPKTGLAADKAFYDDLSGE